MCFIADVKHAESRRGEVGVETAAQEVVRVFGLGPNAVARGPARTAGSLRSCMPLRVY